MVSTARNLISEFLQFRMDVSASVPFRKRAFKVLYALVNSIRSAPLSVSVAVNLSPSGFVFSGLYRDTFRHSSRHENYSGRRKR